MEIFTIGPGAVVKYILYSWPCAPGKSNTCSRIKSLFISYKTIVFCTHMKLAKTRYQKIRDHTGSEGGTERKTWSQTGGEREPRAVGAQMFT